MHHLYMFHITFTYTELCVDFFCVDVMTGMIVKKTVSDKWWICSVCYAVIILLSCIMC